MKMLMHAWHRRGKVLKYLGGGWGGGGQYLEYCGGSKGAKFPAGT